MNKIIGVIGSGTMGNGIAHVFAMCPEVKSVLLVDLNHDILQIFCLIKFDMFLHIHLHIVLCFFHNVQI